MGLMWLLFLEIGLHVQNKLPVLGSTVNAIGEGLCDHAKRMRDFNLTSYNFWISAPIPGCEMILYVTRHR